MFLFVNQLYTVLLCLSIGCIAKSALIRYKKGERVPDAETIARICENHNIDYTWLITGKGSPTEAESYVSIPKYSFRNPNFCPLDPQN